MGGEARERQTCVYKVLMATFSKYGVKQLASKEKTKLAKPNSVTCGVQGGL